MQNLPWNSPNPVARTVSVRQDEGAICLPTDLLAAAPECAVGCIIDFTLANYQENTCPFTSSLTYLCTSTTTTTSGLTIGEGSLQCLLSRCRGTDLERTGVYDVCDSIPGSIPKTIGVITATIQPAATPATMATPFPATIGNPATTQEVTSIVLASGVPSLGGPSEVATSTESNSTSSPSTETDSSSASTASSGGALAMSDRVSSGPDLSTAQIAGIGVGAALVALLTLAVIYWRCRRRDKIQRRRSTRWSMHGARTTPPQYGDPPPDLPVKAEAPDNGLLSIPGSTQRFYAAAPAEEKRRSFWRRSIKPEDIGVAVSPYAANAGSPTSLSSQQSFANLIPKLPEKLPARATKALWPAPLNFETVRNRQSLTFRPTSEVTVFDEDLEANALPHRSMISETRDSIGLRIPSKGRRDRVLPAPLQVNPFDSSSPSRPSAEKDFSPATRIPLTPTYDNGNFVDTPPRMHPPSSWKQMGQRLSPPLSALVEESSPNRNILPHKNVLRKKPGLGGAAQVGRSVSTSRASESKPTPTRKDSETTVATEIEEDTTPEEVERRLEMIQKPKPAAIFIANPDEDMTSPRSPISNLKYPPIPRSAGISRQAEYVPQPFRNLEGPSTPTRLGPVRSRRDQLVRNEASFMVTDTTSSDGYLSDHSIEWPVPPASRGAQIPLRAVMSGLREDSASANRGSGKPQIGRSMDSVVKYGPRTDSLLAPPISSPWIAKRASNSNQAGDLYFKVEI